MPGKTSPGEESAEILALIETLHRTEKRLALLTAGQVDSVLDSEGHSLMLRQSQEALRTSEATRRAAMLDELHDSQALLGMASRIAQVGGWAVEMPAGRLIWSEEMAALHDMPGCLSPSMDEALAYYAPEHRAAMIGALRKCMSDGTPYDVEHEMITARGRRIWVRVIGQAVRNAEGEIVRVQGAVQDLSDRKLVELAARKMATRLTNTLESITDGVAILDRDWRFVFLNSESERMMERERSSLLGRNLWDEFPHMLGTDMERGYRKAMDERVTVRLEAYYEPWQTWFLINAYPSEEGLCIYYRDITQRRIEQSALRDLNAELEGRVLARTAELALARDDAEQANRAKSAFLATMSHEIRTPMNGVIGMIDVLHRTSLKGHQVEMVELIQGSADSLLKIIEDILDFSKIEAGKLSLESNPLQLLDVVEKVCGLLDPIAIGRNVLLNVFVDPAIPGTLLGDETRLRQVLMNLTGNAIKFSGGREASGNVSLRALLRASEPGSVDVDIVVSDDGIGFDDETRQRLFAPFSQADASTTRRFGGTGLGLAICSTLVRLMGGQIGCESAPGKGSTFTVKLRLATTPIVIANPIDQATALLVGGVRCRLIGPASTLGEDLACVLRHVGVHVERHSSIADAASAPGGGEAWVWLLLPGAVPPPVTLSRLRDSSPSGFDSRTSFVSLERGRRRTARSVARSLTAIDIDGLSRRTLYRVLALSAGRLSPDDDGAPADAELPLEESRPRGARSKRAVLVAEDNETNRKVIMMQLELIGYDAEVVGNGREALRRWRNGNYSMLLTDLHMPDIDGYMLTAAIRAEEAASGASRTPIVALTANAARDEELHCLATGMDAYLSKPVRLPKLKLTLERWIGPAGSALESDETRPPSLGIAQPPADLSVLAAFIGDDPVLLREVIQAFHACAGKARVDMRSGADDGSPAASPKDVAAVAHSIKSAARSIGASRLAELCDEIEKSPQTRISDSRDALVEAFLAELDAVDRFIDGADAR